MMTIDEARESPRPSLKNSRVSNKTGTYVSQRTVSIDESKQQRKKKQVERGKSFLDKKLQEEQNDKQVGEREGRVRWGGERYTRGEK